MSRKAKADLTKLVPKSNDVEVPQIGYQTNTEALLVGYTEVPRDQWISIPYKTHIRYLRNDGKMVKGGYVVSLINTTDKDGKNTIKIDIVANMSQPNAMNWSIYGSSIDKIWKQDSSSNQGAMELQNIQTKLNKAMERITELNEKNNLIVGEIQRIKNENNRIIQMVIKLNNKIK
jgi:hypothetical protein